MISTSNNNGNNKRKDLFCSYCKKKGHEVSECRKKKRDEGAGKINMTKELACMAKELKKDDDADTPTIGSCVSCGLWGPAFRESYKCCEDSGCYYIPEPGVDYSDEANAPKDSDDEEEYSEDEGNVTGETPYEVPMPNFVKNWDSKYILEPWDI
jgi:hypothetical protein